MQYKLLLKNVSIIMPPLPPWVAPHKNEKAAHAVKTQKVTWEMVSSYGNPALQKTENQRKHTKLLFIQLILDSSLPQLLYSLGKFTIRDNNKKSDPVLLSNKVIKYAQSGLRTMNAFW